MRAITPIAHIESDFKEKFGVPRQSGMVHNISQITFDAPFRNPDAIKGLENFSHIWLIWDFSMSHTTTFNATVRPPRLGGNSRIGVFASRSPFRPNSIGLSSVKLIEIDYKSPNAPTLLVEGADLVDGTPIFDIKPYIPYTDCHTDATDGYTTHTKSYRVTVCFPEELLEKIPPEKRDATIEMLALDPRPSYIEDPTREYGVTFAGMNIRFTVNEGHLYVKDLSY